MKAFAMLAAAVLLAIGIGVALVSGLPVTAGTAPTKFHFSQLDAVSCTSTHWCVAVGDSLHPTHPLMESWNGSKWSDMPGISSGILANYFQGFGVSCITERWCVAVGLGSSVEMWNGSRWRYTPPKTNFIPGGLLSVSCYSERYCVAVGTDLATRPQSALVESYNGSVWTAEPLPSAGKGATLFSVACIAATSCVAVGQTGSPENSFYSKTLVMRLGPKGWYRMPSPTPEARATLAAVSCTSANHCVAVGYASKTLAGTSPSDGLTVSYGGRTWTAVENTTPRSYQDSPSALACWRDGRCLVVGEQSGPRPTFAANLLVELREQDGRIRVLSPSVQAEDYLKSVACVSQDWCMFVGLIEHNTGSDTLAQLFTGRKLWRAVATPNT